MLISAVEGQFEAYTPNTPGHGRWNMFEHYVRYMGSTSISTVNVPTDTWVNWPNSRDAAHLGIHKDPYFGWAQHTGLGKILPGLSVWYHPNLTFNQGVVFTGQLPANLDLLKQRALKSMLPSIKSEFSVVNSVIELKDFRGLARAILKRFSTYKKLFLGKDTLGNARNYLLNAIKTARLHYNLVNRGNKKALLRELDAAVEAYLQWKFAIAPLISDLNAIRRCLDGSDKKLNNLLSEAGKPQRRHFSCSCVVSSSSSRDDTFNMGYPLYPRCYASCSIEASTSEGSGTFHAEIEYNYNYTGYQIEHARMLALQDRFGFNMNPAIVWNAIPYTFLLDWVLGVSQWLNQFEVGNMDPQINIRRYLWSVTARRYTDWTKIFDSSVPAPPMGTNNRLSMPRISESMYIRRTEGVSVSSIVASGLSSQEVSLGAALAYAIARRRRKR
jgi:succinate dehydrogenase flavin-adding protein (antitoxin of CptAB toxin-antitoxin module)